MARLVTITGAGLSAESGVPTFRDVGGLWSRYDVDVVCNWDTWQKNRVAVHELHNLLRESLPDYQPNAAHRMLAEWSLRYFNRHLVQHLTANVDDLLERAGCGGEVIHLHGYLTHMQCVSCQTKWHVGYRAWNSALDRCRDCGSDLVKPGTVLFNESAPEYIKLNAATAALTRDDVVVVSGCSGQVISPDTWLYGKPCRKILVNTVSTPFVNEKFYDHVILQPAALCIQQVDDVVRAILG